ncbi:MAG: lipid-binding SYLF domain-containing protein [Planctomycetota bacterium]|jgi:lipid-binding SYLF domain-containing protein
MKTMSKFVLLAVCVVVVISGCSNPEGDSTSEKRSYAQTMRKDTMSELYKEKPIAKEQVRNAAGYAVFSNVNINLLLLSSGNGYGIARNNRSGDDIYMKMRFFGVGFGAGVKDFRAVIIFKTDEAMKTFTESGWEWGAHADAAAKSGDKGADVAAAAEVGDMIIYNFTETGIALQATVQGTKYWVDDELN